MKKRTIVLLSLLAAALTVLAARLIIEEMGASYAPTSESPPVGKKPAQSYDGELYEEFLAAEAADDYTKMNEIYDQNMAETGVSFVDGEYDETHGGKIYTYSYSVTGGNGKIKGKLYIVTEDVALDALSAGENDYFAIDRRDKADPEFLVKDSYRTDSAGGEAAVRKLCELLLRHEAAYPSAWERSLESMVYEWQVHNAAYKLGYKTDRSKDVNLNNADENTDWFKRASEEL